MVEGALGDADGLGGDVIRMWSTVRAACRAPETAVRYAAEREAFGGRLADLGMMQ